MTTAHVRRASHREIFGLAVPAVGALASDPLLSLVDTAFVGQLGAVPLAALGVCVAVFTTVFVVFNFLTYGTTAEVARLVGAGRSDEASRYALQALWLAIGLGVAVTVGLLSAGPLIVALMGAEGAVAHESMRYLGVRAFAAVPVLIVQVGHGAFRGLKDTKTPLKVATGINLLNIPLSWWLIHGAGMGVAGAAWGTLVAQVIGAAAFLWLARGRFPQPRPMSTAARRVTGWRRVGSFMGVDPLAMRAIIRISRDLFLRTAALTSALLVSTAAATRLGVTTVAAHQVARELWTMLALVLDGFAIAAQALIATALGAGRGEVARADARRLTWWGLVAGAVIGVGYFALSGVLPGVFIDDRAVLAAVGSVWVLIAVMQPIGGVVFVLDGVLMGAQDFRFLFWSTAVASLGVLAPIAVVALLADWGLVGIWWGMGAMMVTRLVLMLWRLTERSWSHRPVGA